MTTILTREAIAEIYRLHEEAEETLQRSRDILRSAEFPLSAEAAENLRQANAEAADIHKRINQILWPARRKN